MKYSFLSFFLLTAGLTQAQSEQWKALRVNAYLTLQMPASTQEMDVPGTMTAANAPNQHDPQVQASRAFRGEDKAAVYVVVVVPFTGDTKLLADEAARTSYYKNRLVPMLVARAHGELLTQTSFTKNGVSLLTIKYQTLGSTGAPVIKYLRTFIDKQLIYELFFAPKDGTGQTCVAQRNHFFETLAITPGK